ncbi:MAG: zinc ribbon-containing protein [Acidiferrobacteraceae bacterium]
MVHDAGTSPMTQSKRPLPSEPLAKAYEPMLRRVVEHLRNTERVTATQLQKLIREAGAQVAELGDLTTEEAALVGDYLKRDLLDAAHYVASTGSALKDWLGFEVTLMERELIDLFLQAADKTAGEQIQIKQMANAPRYHAGEVAGPGTLTCAACDKKLHFHHPAVIPPCPMCHAKRFRRRY